MKKDFVCQEDFATANITEYVEVFYNQQRKQARLEFLSPAAFERWFYEKRLAA